MPVKVLAEVPLWVYAPSLVIPEIPVSAPVVEISQSEESMLTVPLPPPKESAPLEVLVLMLVAKLEPALRFIVAPEMVAPAVPVRRPSMVIAPMPVIAPVLEISQSEESMATVDVLLPMVLAPVEESVVKAPVEAVVAPMLVELIVPPVIVAPEEAKVFAVRLSEKENPAEAPVASKVTAPAEETEVSNLLLAS